jgi:hypothetical protein
VSEEDEPDAGPLTATEKEAVGCLADGAGCASLGCVLEALGIVVLAGFWVF